MIWKCEDLITMDTLEKFVRLKLIQGDSVSKLIYEIIFQPDLFTVISETNVHILFVRRKHDGWKITIWLARRFSWAVIDDNAERNERHEIHFTSYIQSWFYIDWW